MDIDRTKCPYRYNWYGPKDTRKTPVVCCPIYNKPQLHKACKSISDDRCTWVLNQKIELLERMIKYIGKGLI